MVKLIGLPGIYVGTVVQGLLATAVKPYVLYKHGFQRNVLPYYIDSAKYLAVELVIVAIVSGIKMLILPDLSVLTMGKFIALVLVTAVVPNLIYALVFFRTDEFRFLYDRVGSKIVGKVKRFFP